MKKIIKTAGILLLSLILCANKCDSSNTTNQENVMGLSMKSIEYTYTPYQVDSMCCADTLKNIDEWIHSSFQDYETNKRITKRMYIKKYNFGSEIIYTLLPYQDSLYKVSVRIVKGKE